MSRFGTVESQCGTQLATAAGFSETRTVAAGMLLAVRPDVWPCAFLALIDVKKVGEELQSPGHVTRMCDVNLGVLVLANSDAQETGDARTSAWTLTDAVMDAFAAFVPNLAGTATVWPVEIGDPINVLTDSGQAGVYIPLSCRIQWRS